MKSSIVARWLAYPVVFVAILLLFSVTNRDWVPNVAPFSTLSHSSTNKVVSDGVIAVDGVYVAFTLGKLYSLAQSKCLDELIQTKGFCLLGLIKDDQVTIGGVFEAA